MHYVFSPEKKTPWIDDQEGCTQCGLVRKRMAQWQWHMILMTKTMTHCVTRIISLSNPLWLSVFLLKAFTNFFDNKEKTFMFNVLYDVVFSTCMFIYLVESVKMMMQCDKCFSNILEEKCTKYFYERRRRFNLNESFLTIILFPI